MSFGCSLKQAWGVDSFQKETKTIKDNARAHELPSPQLKRKPAPPAPAPTHDLDTRLLYCIAAGIGAVLALEAAFRMGRSTA
jgi:hypothetical protein